LSVGLVAFHALIGWHGMNVKRRAVGAGDIVGLGWVVRRAFLVIAGLCGVDVKCWVVGAGGIGGDCWIVVVVQYVFQNSKGTGVAFGVVCREQILLSGQVQYIMPIDGIQHPWCNRLIGYIVK